LAQGVAGDLGRACFAARPGRPHHHRLFALRALRWRLLLSGGHQFGFLTVFSANMVGYLGNAFLPARAGEVVRSVMISPRGPLSKTYVLMTAAVERLSDAIALVPACSPALLSPSLASICIWCE
jgi:uncharacterized membrane protein YbhN (UPF0104 family)